MSEEVAIRFPMDQRRAIEAAWIAWQAKEPYDGPRINSMPPLSGPDSRGTMTMHWLPEEFVVHLRSDGFSFDVI
jgi:hypothetical protein